MSERLQRCRWLLVQRTVAESQSEPELDRLSGGCECAGEPFRGSLMQ